MAITNYDELITALRSFLYNRTDLDEYFPLWISMAESDIINNVYHYLTGKESITSINAGDEMVALPSDYKRMISVELVQPKRILYSTSIQDVRSCVDNGLPERYAFSYNQLRLAPIPAQDIQLKMFYISRPESLNAISQTNEILQRFPNAYLYGTLIQAEMALDNETKVTQWATAYSATIQSIKNDHDVGSQTGTPSILAPSMDVY